MSDQEYSDKAAKMIRKIPSNIKHAESQWLWKTILETIEVCIQKGYLAQHLKQDRAEVYRLMLSYFKTLDALRMDRIDYAQRVLVNAFLKAGHTDEEIINVLTGYFKDLS